MTSCNHLSGIGEQWPQPPGAVYMQPEPTGSRKKKAGKTIPRTVRLCSSFSGPFLEGVLFFFFSLCYVSLCLPSLVPSRSPCETFDNFIVVPALPRGQALASGPRGRAKLAGWLQVWEVSDEFQNLPLLRLWSTGTAGPLCFTVWTSSEGGRKNRLPAPSFLTTATWLHAF